jgi:hypothetical protein
MSGGISSNYNSGDNIYTTGWRGAGSAGSAGSADSMSSAGSADPFGSTETGSTTGSFGDWFDPQTDFIGDKTDSLCGQVPNIPRNTAYGINLMYDHKLGTPPLNPGNDWQEDALNYHKWHNENKRK